jgi:hypothetical protein
MYHNVILPAVISVLLAAPAVAIEPTLGARLGTSMVDISAALSADGYEMTSFAQAGDWIEIQAVKGRSALTQDQVRSSTMRVRPVRWTSMPARMAIAGS